ncbi:hypothetical protein V6N12_005659 [Hibiscus sabdariffa]|uniref:Uncharacterized protein n=1 Tax=Hibiscus sabdariffa TaxID=183260 RepID=A0ABR2BAP6_9ROSI
MTAVFVVMGQRISIMYFDFVLRRMNFGACDLSEGCESILYATIRRVVAWERNGVADKLASLSQQQSMHMVVFDVPPSPVSVIVAEEQRF